jgi:hypothetical protein
MSTICANSLHPTATVAMPSPRTRLARSGQKSIAMEVAERFCRNFMSTGALIPAVTCRNKIFRPWLLPADLVTLPLTAQEQDLSGVLNHLLDGCGRKKGVGVGY